MGITPHSPYVYDLPIQSACRWSEVEMVVPPCAEDWRLTPGLSTDEVPGLETELYPPERIDFR